MNVSDYRDIDAENRLENGISVGGATEGDIEDDDGDENDTVHGSPQPYYDDNNDDDDDKNNKDLNLRVHDSNGAEPPELPKYFHDEDEDEEKETVVKKMINYFRPYWILDFLDWKSIKIVIRTWVAVWVAAILTIVPKSGQWLGQAAFLIILFQFMLACGGFSIITSLFVSVLIMAFSMFGFLHSVIAMAVAARVRGNHDKTYYIQQVVQEGLCQNDQTLPGCFQTMMFHGHFLTTRTTAVFIIAILVGLITCISIKLKSKALTIGGVIGIINISIPLLYGSLIPYFDPLLMGLVVIKPLGLALALNLACCCLIFPKSSNFSFVDGLCSCLKMYGKMAEIHVNVLKKDRPSYKSKNHNFERHRKLRNIAAQLRGKMMSIQSEEGLMGMEISYGRIDRHTASEFSSLMKKMLKKMQGLEVFFGFIDDCKKILLKDKRTLTVGNFEQKQLIELKQLTHGVSSLKELDDLMDHIYSMTKPVMGKANHAFNCALSWLESANQFRVYSFINRKSHVKRQRECAERLTAALYEFEQLLQEFQSEKVHYTGIEDTNIHIRMQSNFVAFIVSEVCETMIKMMSLLSTVDNQRPTPCLLFPWTKPLDLPDNNKDDDKDENNNTSNNSNAARSRYRDPEAREPQNIFQKLGLSFYKLQRQVGNDKMFWVAVRCAIFTIASATPLFVRTTTWWFYSNRLVWVPIMVAMSANGYLGDNVYVTMVNIFYTFVGAVIGLAGWYIGNGHGTGNYYGCAAVYAVFSVFLLFYRHFSRHFRPMPPIFVCVTFTLVMGTSWVDANQPSIANIGYGWKVAWVRFVTVIVGLAIGSIAMLLPKPYTLKKVVRVNLGDIMKRIGQLHGDVGSFALNSTNNNKPDFSEIHTLLFDTISKNLTIQFEPALQGEWPKDLYFYLLKTQWDVVLLYEYMTSLFEHEYSNNYTTRSEMLKNYGWMNTQLTADMLAAMHMCGASLTMKSPLPLLTSTILGQRFVNSHEIVEGETNLTGYAIMEHIYNKLDVMVVVTKQLVGEEYQFDNAFM